MQRLARPVVPLKEAERDAGLFPLLQPEGGLGRSLRRIADGNNPPVVHQRECQTASKLGHLVRLTSARRWAAAST
jgi:hypothetical protein